MKVRTAIEAARKGEYRDSLPVLREYAEQGDVGASYVLGKLYALGLGVETSVEMAEKLLLANAENEHTPSMLALAQIKFTTAPSESLLLIRQAASLGDTVAITELGSVFESGKLGVQKNLDRAFTYYEKASESGSPFGDFHLARFYDQGLGVSANEVLATRLYRKAAMNGVVAANAVMAKRYLEGKGLEADPIAAIGWLTRGAQNGLAEAMVILGSQYEAGETVIQDFNRAGQLYSQAAKLGDSAGTFRLAMMYLNGKGVKADPVRAYVLLTGAQALPDAKEALKRLKSSLSASQLKLAEQQVEKIAKTRLQTNK